LRHFRITVHPSFRRQKIGTSLIDIVFAQDSIASLTYQSNLMRDWNAGKIFLSKYGFLPGHEELFMELRSNPNLESSPVDGIRTRSFLATDLEACASLHNNGYRGKAGFVEASTETFTQEATAEGFQMWVATSDERIIGFCNTYHASDNTGVVNSLVVNAGFSGRGIGRGLLTTALAGLHKDGRTRIELNVDSNNVSAIGLYYKVGFEVSDSMTSFNFTKR
jgi:mycothiol synthase